MLDPDGIELQKSVSQSLLMIKLLIYGALVVFFMKFFNILSKIDKYMILSFIRKGSSSKVDIVDY